MPNYAVYIDDSGTKEYAATSDLYGKGNTRYFVFGGALLTIDEAGRLSQAIADAKQEYFGHRRVEIKSTWLRQPKNCQKEYLDKYNITPERLTEFVNIFYGLVCEADLQLIAAVVDKIHMQEKYKPPQHPYYPPAVAYEFFMQRVVQECQDPGCVTVLIDDMSGATPKGNQYKDNLKAQHERLRKLNSRFLPKLSFAPLSPGIRFVNSAKSNLIQVADIVSYNIYRQFVEHGEQWEEKGLSKLPSYEWFARICRKFRQGPDRRIQGYGVTKMPMRHRVPWKAPEK